MGIGSRDRRVPLNQLGDSSGSTTLNRTPTILYPTPNLTGVQRNYLYVFSEFKAADAFPNETHIETSFQITNIAGNYTSPVYNGSITSGELTKLKLPSGTLAVNTSFYARVAYKGSSSGWSLFSPEVKFTTAAEFMDNYWGTGADGDLTIAAGQTVVLPSTKDGDMIVKNYNNLTIQAGGVLTVSNRCRGLLIYVKGNLFNSGTITMTGKGCFANPQDSAVSVNTPVAPSDGHRVPYTGITIRRAKAGGVYSHDENNLMYGCGNAAVSSELNQVAVENGLVVSIPTVGLYGTAGSCAGGGGTIAGSYPIPESYLGLALRSGGGAGAGASSWGCVVCGSPGAAGTCFCGGSGGVAVAEGAGGCYSVSCGYSAPQPSNYGGCGGGGLLILLVKGIYSNSGVLSANGAVNLGESQCVGPAGCYTSAGGVVLALYGGQAPNGKGSLTATGNNAGSTYCDQIDV